MIIREKILLPIRYSGIGDLTNINIKVLSALQISNNENAKMIYEHHRRTIKKLTKVKTFNPWIKSNFQFLIRI